MLKLTFINYSKFNNWCLLLWFQLCGWHRFQLWHLFQLVRLTSTSPPSTCFQSAVASTGDDNSSYMNKDLPPHTDNRLALRYDHTCHAPCSTCSQPGRTIRPKIEFRSHTSNRIQNTVQDYSSQRCFDVRASCPRVLNRVILSTEERLTYEGERLTYEGDRPPTAYKYPPSTPTPTVARVVGSSAKVFHSFTKMMPLSNFVEVRRWFRSACDVLAPVWNCTSSHHKPPRPTGC